MADLDRIERERMLAQLRELGGLAAGPPPAPAPAEPAPAPKLTPREQRRLTAHIERLTAFKAELGRLPSAAPTAPTGERTLGAWMWRQRKAREDGTLHPHAAELLQETLGPYWHLPPRKAKTLEQQVTGGMASPEPRTPCARLGRAALRPGPGGPQAEA